MKLLALVTDAFGELGGIARFNRDLLTALSEGEGANHIVVVPRHGKANPSELPIAVKQLASADKYPFVVAALRAAIIEGPFDAVFCGHIHLAPLAASIAALLRRPLWLQLHGMEAWGPLSRLQRLAAERATLVTAVSRYTRRRFLQLTRIDPFRVRVLPNTIGAGFSPGPKPDYLLDRHKLRGRQVLLTVGRLIAAERGKGHDRMLQVLPELLKTHPKLVYLVVGDGDDRKRFEKLAMQAGFSRVVLFAGPVPSEELGDYYRLADVFVMPSTQEGFGIVFLEAAASGLAVIGGNSDGTVDALGDGAIGRMVDPVDGTQLAEAIRVALARGGVDPAQVHRFRFGNFALHLRNLIATRLLCPAMTGVPGSI
jgi:phosphatidyl-myo-inositol dimannoside synthase